MVAPHSSFPVEGLMRHTAVDVLTALAIPAISALGGALAVYSGYDDAPGGVLLGILLITGALGLALRTSLSSS
jgi:hypothetical protein